MRPQQLADTDDGADADHSPHGDGDHNGDDVTLEVCYLLVQDVAEGDYRGAEHEVDHTAAALEGIVGHI